AAATLRAIEANAQDLLFPAAGRVQQRDNSTAGELERQLDALGETGPNARADRDSIDDRLDRVRFRLRELGRRVGHLDDFAVHACADQTGSANRAEDLDVLPLSAPDQRCQDLDLSPFIQFQELVDHLLEGLALNRDVACGAMRNAGAGIE